MDRLAEWRRRHAENQENGEENPSPDNNGPIDLDEERSAASLEDPELIAHMAHARHLYQESQQALSTAPDEGNVRQTATVHIGVLSGILRSLDEEFTKIETASGEVHVIGKHLGEWKMGRKMEPFFPQALGKSALADPVLQSGLERARTTLQKNSQIIKTYASGAREMRKKLSMAHMALSKCWDDFRTICEAQQKIIDSQKRLLVETRAVWDKDQVDAEASYYEVTASTTKSSAKEIVVGHVLKEDQVPAEAPVMSEP